MISVSAAEYTLESTLGARHNLPCAACAKRLVTALDLSNHAEQAPLQDGTAIQWTRVGEAD